MRFASFVLITALGIAQATALDETQSSAVAALVKAYPDFLERIDGNDLVWKDGTRQRIDDGKAAKTFEAMLDEPDIKDMFAMTYPAGDKGLAPAVNFDPGRIRYMPLFLKMYGDCQKSNLAAGAADVVWLRSKYGKTVKLSKINGAAAALQKVSDELDRLPDKFLEYLRPLQGSYNCRPIAGTNRLSAHGLGIASISPRRIRTTGCGQSPMRAAASATRTRSHGRSCACSRRTASCGAASGTITTPCISSTGPRY